MDIKKECEDCKYEGKCACYECSRLARKDMFEAKVKEIRPENRDEYWQYNATKVGYVYNEQINKLVTARGNKVSGDVVHGKGGWERIHPPVEDDSINAKRVTEILHSKIQFYNCDGENDNVNVLREVREALAGK